MVLRSLGVGQATGWTGRPGGPPEVRRQRAIRGARHGQTQKVQRRVESWRENGESAEAAETLRSILIYFSLLDLGKMELGVD